MRLQLVEEAVLAPCLDLLLRFAGEFRDRLVGVELRHVLGGQQQLPDVAFGQAAAPADLLRACALNQRSSFFFAIIRIGG